MTTRMMCGCVVRQLRACSV